QSPVASQQRVVGTACNQSHGAALPRGRYLALADPRGHGAVQIQARGGDHAEQLLRRGPPTQTLWPPCPRQWRWPRLAALASARTYAANGQVGRQDDCAPHRKLGGAQVLEARQGLAQQREALVRPRRVQVE